MLDYNLFSKYKTKQDFDREAAEFEFRKRQQQMQEQMDNIKLEQMKQPQMPFEGTSFDSQIANEAYKFNRSKGMSDAEARQKAIDMVLGSKTDYSQVTDPYTGQTSIVPRKRQGIFSNGQAQQPVNGQGMNEQVLQQPIQQPTLQQPPSQVVGQIPQETYPAQNLQPQVPQVPQDSSQLQIDPRAFNSPDVQKALAQKQAESELSIRAGIKKQNLEQIPAKKNFDVALASVLDAATELRDLGAGVRTSQGVGQNVLSRARSTEIGQGVEQFVGTREQELRDFIDSKRPLMFNAIKKATGLTGTELNSRFEVENQLKQLGNDKINIDTRIKILKDLSDQFGLGMVEEFTKYKGQKQRLKYNPATGRLE